MVERQYDLLKKERMKLLEDQKPRVEQNGTTESTNATVNATSKPVEEKSPQQPEV